MPFPFAYVCDLLEKLEEPFLREVGFLPGTLREYLRKHTSSWFLQHCAKLNAFSTDDKAVLSMLWPHQQTDRQYGLDSASLELVIARALSLTRSQYLEIGKWRTDPVQRDLAFFVHQVMKESNSASLTIKSNKITAEDIDQALLQIASHHPKSSLEVQSLAETWPDADHVSLLGDLYQSLQPREIKWLTRLVLKSLGPLKIPEDLELSASFGHSYLPRCLQVSIKMPTGIAAPIRREGPLMMRGSADTSTPAKTPSNPLSNTQALPLTPQPSTIMLPPIKPPMPLLLPRKSISLTPPTSSSTLPVSRSSRNRESMSTSTISSSLLSACPLGRQPPLAPESPSRLSVHENSVHHRKPSSELSRPALRTSVEENASKNATQVPLRRVLGELSFNTKSKSQSPSSQARDLVKGTGICQLSTSKCPLRHYIFVLSPCISSNSYIIDSLLRWHGVPYITSNLPINHPSIPRLNPRTGKRYVKIVLVEPNAPKPTAQFLGTFAKLDLKQQGKKGLLKVYDWRLLESIMKADMGKELSHDPWVRMFIGRI